MILGYEPIIASQQPQDQRRKEKRVDKFQEILAGIPQEIRTLEVDTEKKIFKLNGVDFGKGCDFLKYRAQEA